MSTVASIHIETWGGKFVIVGEFAKTTVIPRIEYNTYGEALKEMAKIIQREVLRHESGVDRSSHW